MQPRTKAMWTVAFLWPVFGELVTGSTSPIAFVAPSLSCAHLRRVLAFFALRDIFCAGGPGTVGLRAVGAVYLHWVHRLDRRLWPLTTAGAEDVPSSRGEDAPPPVA